MKKLETGSCEFIITGINILFWALKYSECDKLFPVSG